MSQHPSPTQTPPPPPLPPPPPPPPSTTTATPATTTTTAAATRRVPPPCWTHDETMALIDAYHEKWYSLRRGNLKASHWQEVADSVARRCRLSTPSKTSVQCRHKIEKLRKRYRTEKQRSAAAPSKNHGRFASQSSWVFFKKMDDMERGPSYPDENLNLLRRRRNQEEEEDEDDDEDDADDDEDDSDDDGAGRNNNGSLQQQQQHHHHHLMSNGSGSGSGGGFRFRIPSGQRSAVFNPGSAKPKSFVRAHGNSNPNPNPNCNNSAGPRVLNSGTWARSGGGGGNKREMDPVAEMVSSIRMLGEGFVRTEQMKIEMAREIEQMRMDMEMKRTEMILESQQRIVEAFAKGFSGKKKAKRMPSPES